MIEIRHRGQVVQLVADVAAAYDWLVAHQRDSVGHAITRGGYEARDLETRQRVTFWTGGRNRRDGKFKAVRTGNAQASGAKA